ncbi:hypothetical protein [Streptomyces sp. NPDC048650]|uniref:hypothetical protein n=1 Tax=Streptomyces sp. NPDC048650 TaxID=3365583 RepID=UPI0037198169
MDTSAYPSIVEVVFVDADGVRHSIIDKTLLFWDADEEPEPNTEFPLAVRLDAMLVESGLPGNRVRVVVDHRSVSDDGYAEFTVFAHQVTAETSRAAPRAGASGRDGASCPVDVARADG